ncbi:hypothetical protein [Vibrio penaeicida]|uniref:hypothetical protein n=1 Tax=Vibrio penaeicida TaxID=104609 RepID=UPI000CEA3FAA|nr:hypothetical protein [Vibrio penaeicida]
MTIEKAWNGNLALWKAVVFISILGLIITFITGAAIGLGMLQLKQSGLVHLNLVTTNAYTMSFLLIVYGVFATKCVWLSSKSAKSKMRNVLAKLWALLVLVYISALTIHFISAI